MSLKKTSEGVAADVEEEIGLPYIAPFPDIPLSSPNRVHVALPAESMRQEE